MIKKDVELFIVKSVFGGDGFALHEGKVYFVEGALPGERVLASVTEEKKNFSRARIAKILQSSPHRVEPPCRYASHCGGCQYQHADYREELRLKEAQLAEILKTVPEITPDKIGPIVASPADYGYRNSVTLHPILSKKSKTAKLGFIAKDNVSKIAVQNCLLVDPKLSSIFSKEYTIKKDDKVTFKLSEGSQIVSDSAATFFRVRLGGESFLTSSRGFFQNNLPVAALLAEKVREWTRSVKPDVFFDLYAGVGVFSILCAKEVKKIVCVEESPESVQALRMNREERKMTSLEIMEGRVEKTFPALWEKEKTASLAASLVFLDPPRQGITPDLARFLAQNQGMGALVYVSCDPVTLARDLKLILSSGRWKFRQVVPFDMFPRTMHLETAAFLTSI